MRIVPFQLLALGAAILSCSSAFAVTLEGGAVAAPDQYGAQVAADILKKAATPWTPPWPPRSPWR